MDYGNLKVPENVTPEVQAILDSYEARNKEIERNHKKEMAKLYGGAALQIGSAFIPGTLGLKAASGAIKALTPYVATGLGGGLYELGQGIMEGDKAPELLKKTGIGAGIGVGFGAVAGKALPAFAKSKAGQAIGNQASKLYNSFADTKIGQKVSEIAPKVEDLLMTDIKAFNPNRQTVYHGSPKDFNKFSNEAIGSGEGNQVHGYGHYAAKNKNIADERYRKRLSSGDYEIAGEKLDDPFQEATLRDVMAKGKSNVIAKYEKDLLESKKIIDDFESKYTKNELFQNDDLYLPYDNARDRYMNTLERYDFIKNIDENSITKNEGQLYKLSIPKDDVMLREDELFNYQPQKVQDILWDIAFDESSKGNRELLEVLGKNKSGKEIYETIWDTPNTNGIYGNKGASKLLSEKGIKGISYNGGIDGEANVIFNPDDIEIVRKYYNQPSLYELIKKQKPFYGGVSNALYDYITGE